MRFSRLTLWGAFASVQDEKGRFGSTARVLWWTGWLALGVGLVGCAGISADSSAEAKQRLVSERAEARWQALIKGDVDAAYQFLSAGSKAATSLAAYKAKVKPGLWRKAKVDKVKCEAEICKADVTVTYDYRNVKGLDSPVPETWIIENGSAWYVYH
jgi:hypothetical protein